MFSIIFPANSFFKLVWFQIRDLIAENNILVIKLRFRRNSWNTKSLAR